MTWLCFSVLTVYPAWFAGGHSLRGGMWLQPLRWKERQGKGGSGHWPLPLNFAGIESPIIIDVGKHLSAGCM